MQSDGYQSVYFHKIWVEYYCLDKNQAPEILSSKFIRCKVHTSAKSQNFVDTLAPQNPCGQNSWNLIFFLKRQGYRYYQEKIQVGITSSSYINLTMKLLINCKITQKQGKNETLHSLGSHISFLLQIGSTSVHVS